MRLKAEDLTSHLSRQLLPIYMVSGDEPLLILEAADAIRQQARTNGFNERIMFHPEGMKWDAFAAETQSMSLFAEQRIIELHIPNGKPGIEGSKALVQYCANPAPDTLLLIICGKIEQKQLSSKWVKGIEDAGSHVRIWPVKPREMPHWLRDRLVQAGIQANRQAIDILADRVEGNLLAAKQEVEKLKLLVDEGTQVDGPHMSSLVADSARYDVFTLIDRMLAGEAEDVWRTIKGLKEEGTELVPLTIMLSREIRGLLAVSEATQQGQSFETACLKAGIWKSRMPQVRGVLRHLKPNTLRLAIRHCRLIDRMSKGGAKGDPWIELSSLCLMIARQNPRTNSVTRAAFSH